MAIANIEYINNRVLNTQVITQPDNTPLDLKPIDYENTSFKVVTGIDSGGKAAAAAPANTTHALVTCVSGSIYVRNGSTAPTTSTGGVCIMGGASRLFICAEGDTLDFVSTA